MHPAMLLVLIFLLSSGSSFAFLDYHRHCFPDPSQARLHCRDLHWNCTSLPELQILAQCEDVEEVESRGTTYASVRREYCYHDTFTVCRKDTPKMESSCYNTESEAVSSCKEVHWRCTELDEHAILEICRDLFNVRSEQFGTYRSCYSLRFHRCLDQR
ncbi:MAG: hypothetical protein A2284_04975 [Deltaproteobacteria bacterium RIFOXYA12_FULL_61_11]|nr:MAG: hypothetical protein A2284_04975 [Deltaproteobacteria bacterium RIFOXYA12_FULL_61_11]